MVNILGRCSLELACCFIFVANTELPIGRHFASSDHSTDNMLAMQSAEERRQFEAQIWPVPGF